ncbi:hypothetical protein DKM44_07780 [Deinococcus irradiatisoli]|uniref:DUF1211 domain-containing protein n=1 Tax=Deinococcus irradiatisoli TaxID=2202254 RepID=A0A2Z3JD95_9DEIO|nr:TMEM175 family protein [Deinococcus irradiatisoli]AWN23137.1 hypothetical protein DKM44_07780 [Deinococcus irradiatisoli]
MTPPDASDHAPDLPEAVPAGRLHGLSDGVFAIVMTLLVLELRLPELAGEVGALGPAAQNAEVLQGLADLTGKLSIYFMTFVVTGLSWLGHSRLYAQIRQIDQRLGFLNVLYLMMVSLLPFSAALIGEHGNVPAGIAPYALNQMLISASFLVMLRRTRQQEINARPEVASRLQQRSVLNLAVFTVMLGLAFIWSPLAWFTPFLLLLAHPLLGRWLRRRPSSTFPS